MNKKSKINDIKFNLNIEDDLHISCIYKIIDVEKQKIYIGKATNLLNRYNSHKTDLKLNRHCNKILQRLFNKGRKLTMKIIEKVNVENLFEKENYYINLYKTLDRNYGYNLAENVKGGHAPSSIDVYDKNLNFIETLNSVNSAVGKYSTNRGSVSQILRKVKNYKFTKQGYTFCYNNQKLNITPYKHKWKHHE